MIVMEKTFSPGDKVFVMKSQVLAMNLAKLETPGFCPATRYDAKQQISVLKEDNSPLWQPSSMSAPFVRTPYVSITFADGSVLYDYRADY